MNDTESKEAAALKKQAKADKQLAGDVQKCLASDEGRRLMDHLKEYFGVNKPIFRKASNRRHEDPLIDAAISDGNDEVVRYLEEILTLSYTTK